jgi:hypothetical protein
MSLTRIEQSLLLATFFRGNPPDQDWWTSSCDQVVTLSLYYTGEITFEECQGRFSKKSYVSFLYDSEGELTSEIRSRYEELIRFLRGHPNLIQGGGDLDMPADPTYTACRLTKAGDELIPSIIRQFPAKPDFPRWPDRRQFEPDA